jgi:hypothetical protein
VNWIELVQNKSNLNLFCESSVKSSDYRHITSHGKGKVVPVLN